MNAFFDSSALVKRYVEEDGRERVINIFDEASAIGKCYLFSRGHFGILQVATRGEWISLIMNELKAT